MKKDSTMTADQDLKTTGQATPLAIIGMGCLFPKSDNLQAYWANIVSGTDAITEVPPTHWRAEDYFSPDPKTPDHVYAKRGGFLAPIDFNPMEYGILPNALEAIDTSQLLSLVATAQALKDAGYGPDRDFDRNRTSVLLGVTGTLELVIPLGARLGHPIWRKALKESGVPDEVAEDVVARIGDAYVPWQENSFPGLLGNVVAGRISKHFNLGGTNCVIDAACGSSLGALHMAAMELQCGRADMVVTGGVDTFNDVFMYTCFSKTPALSPTGDARPFSQDADGTLIGEGLGIMVLKRLADAERDGDRIYAVIKGVGTGSDGKGGAIYEPSPEGQKKALLDAYGKSGVDPHSISMIEAHGTGTKVGDAVEIKALRDVYGQNDGRPWCAIGSVKSQIGHTKAAAGSAGIIKTALSLYHKVLPPTIKVSAPAKEFDAPESPFYVNTTARPWLPKVGQPRRAAVSSFGFGGSNYHCVLEEYKTEKEQSDWNNGAIQLVTLSGASVQELGQALAAIPQDNWQSVRIFAARSRRDFSPSAAHRLAFVLNRDNDNLEKRLSSIRSLLAKQADKSEWSTPDGIYYSSSAETAPCAVLFPGQGAQYPGMLHDLALAFPQMQASLDAADAVFASELNDKTAAQLSDLIYPPAAFSGDGKTRQEDELRATQVAQPALGAVSLGAYRLLEDFGFRPQAAAGHSYGELSALCAAGYFDNQTLQRLSRLRGVLMAGDGGDKGSMLAVSAPLLDVEIWVKEQNLELVLANRNTPKQVVLSGKRSEISRAASLLKEKGWKGTELSVAAAFHSPLVADASKPFLAELKNVSFAKAELPVFSNTTAEPYPATAQSAKKLLANQLAEPVEFVSLIENIYARGIRTFVEIGPGARLSGMVKAILADRPGQAVALDSGNGKRHGIEDLGRLLAQLAVNGQPLNLSLWDQGCPTDFPEAKKTGMSVQLCGANYMKPRQLRPPRAPMVSQSAVAGPARTSAVAPPAVAAPSAPVPQQTSAPAPSAAASPNMSAALRLSQDSLHALRDLQEQTAKLHQQFLEGQQIALQSMRSLIEQQQRLVTGGSIGTAPVQTFVPPVPTVVSPPVPVVNQTQLAPQASPMAVTALIQPPASPGLDVAGVLLGVVADKTGYPREMLELDMALDADLGIDSIKRVEILSALQEQLPQLPAITPDQLGSLQTLQQIVDHLGAVTPGASVVPAAASPALGSPSADVAGVLLGVVADKTGYPREMLELDMALDADLGIDSIKRVEILSALQEQLPQLPAITPDQLGSLQTLQQIVAHLGTVAPAASSAAAVPKPTQPAADVAGVLLAVVADKTGYPREMLELDMALDADLGIDSIKRVEILSALQEQLPQLPAITPDQLGSLQTLQQIVDHLGAGTPAPAAPVAASQISSTPGVDVAVVLLDVIADKTGYPLEMLELTMALDADLGIDSIKRVEILSALQEKVPVLPAITPDQLGSLQTLQQIVDHLGAGTPAPAAPVAASQISSTPGVDVAAVLLDVIADKTGYPLEMLELTMALDADLGIDSIKRVEILSALQEKVPELPAITPDQLGSLQTLQQIVDYLTSKPEGVAAPQVEAAPPANDNFPATPIARQLVTCHPFDESERRGRFAPAQSTPLWVTDDGSELSREVCDRLKALGHPAHLIDLAQMGKLKTPDSLGGLLVLAPIKGIQKDFYPQVLRLLQIAAPALRSTGRNGGSCFLTVARLDGAFGLAGGLLSDPLSGGLAGFAKTAALEWPEVHCRALDLAQDAESPAERIVQEVYQNGPAEVGLCKNKTCALQLQDQALDIPRPEAPLSPSDVVVVTGGARGVTAEIAVAIADWSQASLLLLGRSPAPTEEPAWLVSLESESAIKKAILEQAGAPLKPKDIEERYQAIAANREMLGTLRRIEAAGSRVLYHSVDVRDDQAVATLLNEVRSNIGPVRGLVHGAGVLADRFIEDQTEEQFQRVYQTKVDGLLALLSATRQDDLTFLVLFSSTTARLGRKGQASYAVANEILNKLAQAEHQQRAGCRVVSINWGPWEGGMVTPALKKVFTAEGIGLIGLQAGAAYCLKEMSLSSEGPVEVVVLGESSTAVEPPAAQENLYLTTALEFDLDVIQYPFLKSHVIDGKAVLPMAMILEWMAQGALHTNPGLKFHGFNDLRILKGVTLKVDQAPTILVKTGVAFKSDGSHVVPVELASREVSGREILHARSRILLTSRLPQAKGAQEELSLLPYPHGSDVIYREGFLFHGPDFRGLRQVTGCSAEGIAALSSPAPSPSRWLLHPLRTSWLADPLVIDASFQMMILWSLERFGAASLPCFAGRYRQYRSTFPADGARVVVHVRKSNQHSATADIDYLDPNSGELVAQMLGYECTIDAGLNQVFQHNRLPGKADWAEGAA